jgi:FMN-dependent oxidoreductase (nitrilotriacetate monooxygenase family)
VPNDKPPAGDGRQLHLGYRHVPNGAHPAGWRYPGADRSRGFDPDYVVEVARTAQRAKFDFFLLEDSLATGAQQPYTGASSTAALEAFTTAAYLATLTRGIGLAVTADSAYYEPFNLARLTASLDYVTHGRGAWNIVVGSDQRAAHNYSLREAADEFSLYGRAYEFVDLVRALWDSWEDDAYVRNKDTGEFVDGSKIHPVDHDGKIFKVRGPLNVARPPQGHPLTLHEGNSELARQFAAQHADIAIGGGPTIAESQAYSADLRRRAAELGRDPAEIFVLPVLTPIVGKTFEQARSLYDELNSWLVLDRGVAEGALEALSRHIAFDVTDRDLSSVVPLAASTSIGPAGVTLISTASHRTGRAAGTDLVWRDVLNAHIVGDVVVGGPVEVTDHIERWFVAGASDGFIVQSTFLPQQLTAFTDLVVPELNRRGLFRTDYEGSTLRDHFRLGRPDSRFGTIQKTTVA